MKVRKEANRKILLSKEREQKKSNRRKTRR